MPEIYDGLITIKKIVRAPGERSKVAVESYDDRIDPVGSCVGMKGGRIHGIVRELRNENIDVINYTTNSELFIQRALNPAKVSSIKVLPEEGKAEVYMKPEEVSLAIGKGGHNIKLASKITGFETAKSVLALSPEELLKRSELEEETIASVLEILKAEFEE